LPRDPKILSHINCRARSSGALTWRNGSEFLDETTDKVDLNTRVPFFSRVLPVALWSVKLREYSPVRPGAVTRKQKCARFPGTTSWRKGTRLIRCFSTNTPMINASWGLSGHEAFQLLTRFKFDLALLDIYLPDIILFNFTIFGSKCFPACS